MHKKGFTLIELMVVIAIIAILSILSYAPYNHYANISRVRFSAQKIEQAINESRASVLGGFSFSGGTIPRRQNVHIAIVFSGSADSIEMRGYPASMGIAQITANGGESIRKIPLENLVKIVGGESKMVVFLSPNAERWSGVPGNLKKDETLSLDIAFKEALSGSPLRKSITIANSVIIK